MPLSEPDEKTAQTATPNIMEKVLDRIAGSFNLVAVAALLLMFAVMVADILSAKILNRPITATVDVASVLALSAAAFSVSRTILAKRHIEVEFFVVMFPPGVRKVFNTLASLLTLVFFILIVWRSFMYGLSLQQTGESSLTTHIPMSPFAYGIAIACVPAVLIYACQAYRDMKEVR
jgi:TRAP-type C4-dicarboxylate transport system permease small subunit